MHDRTEDEARPERWAGLARYLPAVVPMLFHGGIMAWVAFREPGRLTALLVDVGLGVAGLALLAGWRRWPLPVALATALLTAFSSTAVGPAYAAYVSLGSLRGWRPLVPTAAVSFACLAVSATSRGIDQVAVVSLTGGSTILAALTALGLYLRGRRDLAASRREAALAARRAERQRIEQARLAERVKIAQEMHDVLAHRISLLSMLAGGLAYRTDLGAQETRELALAIQENAHQSLNELRAVLGTLRRDDGPPEGSPDGPDGAGGAGDVGGAGAAGPEAPQPTLAQLGALFDEVRAAGQRVEVADTIEGRELLPPQTGRHAYRIVQEALTNARKHAPGSRVTAELGGRPGGGLRIRVSNPVPPGGPSPGPGGRLGLVGVAERTRMAGGNLSHAVQNGCFVLDVRLPWEGVRRDPTPGRG
ncbi:histidine kinase [Nonomuraea muscovyensis]|uniref:sensor histidine kinase n=1 Tax=Nonomuraea muscovyensis TaxID=1124761 RepID=UPI0033FF0870